MLALAFATLTACSYAELVSKYPQAGGAASFAERAFRRPVLSFLVDLLVGMAASSMLSADALSISSAPLLDVIRASGYGVPPRLFGLIALVAVSNGALLTMVMASRLTYGMAYQGMIPAALARVLPVRKTPWAHRAAP